MKPAAFRLVLLGLLGLLYPGQEASAVDDVAPMPGFVKQAGADAVEAAVVTTLANTLTAAGYIHAGPLVGVTPFSDVGNLMLSTYEGKDQDTWRNAFIVTLKTITAVGLSKMAAVYTVPGMVIAGWMMNALPDLQGQLPNDLKPPFWKEMNCIIRWDKGSHAMLKELLEPTWKACKDSGHSDWSCEKEVKSAFDALPAIKALNGALGRATYYVHGGAPDKALSTIGWISTYEMHARQDAIQPGVVRPLISKAYIDMPFSDMKSDTFGNRLHKDLLHQLIHMYWTGQVASDTGRPVLNREALVLAALRKAQEHKVYKDGAVIFPLPKGELDGYYETLFPPEQDRVSESRTQAWSWFLYYLMEETLGAEPEPHEVRDFVMKALEASSSAADWRACVDHLAGERLNSHFANFIATHLLQANAKGKSGYATRYELTPLAEMTDKLQRVDSLATPSLVIDPQHNRVQPYAVQGYYYQGTPQARTRLIVSMPGPWLTDNKTDLYIMQGPGNEPAIRYLALDAQVAAQYSDMFYGLVELDQDTRVYFINGSDTVGNEPARLDVLGAPATVKAEVSKDGKTVTVTWEPSTLGGQDVPTHFLIYARDVPDGMTPIPVRGVESVKKCDYRHVLAMLPSSTLSWTMTLPSGPVHEAPEVAVVAAKQAFIHRKGDEPREYMLESPATYSTARLESRNEIFMTCRPRDGLTEGEVMDLIIPLNGEEPPGTNMFKVVLYPRDRRPTVADLTSLDQQLANVHYEARAKIIDSKVEEGKFHVSAQFTTSSPSNSGPKVLVFLRTDGLGSDTWMVAETNRWHTQKTNRVAWLSTLSPEDYLKYSESDTSGPREYHAYPASLPLPETHAIPTKDYALCETEWMRPNIAMKLPRGWSMRRIHDSSHRTKWLLESAAYDPGKLIAHSICAEIHYFTPDAKKDPLQPDKDDLDLAGAEPFQSLQAGGFTGVVYRSYPFQGFLHEDTPCTNAWPSFVASYPVSWEEKGDKMRFIVRFVRHHGAIHMDITSRVRGYAKLREEKGEDGTPVKKVEEDGRPRIPAMIAEKEAELLQALSTFKLTKEK